MHEKVTLNDCYVYHWFDMPNGETLVGAWDLRQNWRAYLDGVDLGGKRVLETGPACGFLSRRNGSDGRRGRLIRPAAGDCAEPPPHPGPRPG